MGAVYEVVHLETRRRRALKVMLPSVVADPAMRARFKLEMTVTAEIDSDHIVETLDAGVDPETGAPFLVMELLRGDELGAILERRKRLPAHEVVMLLWQAASALDRTHAAGIVHRDLKPENLFITYPDDGTQRLKILDFGIAKVISQSAHTAKQTTTIGTPLYMSPEQISGDGAIGPRADLYALGHIAFTLLVGSPFWTEEAKTAPSVVSLLVKVMRGTQGSPLARAAASGMTLPPAFEPWFAKATAVAAADRFEKASSLVTALASALGVGVPRPGAVMGEGFAGARPERLQAELAPRTAAQPVPPPLASSGDSGPTALSRQASASGPQGTVVFGTEAAPLPGGPVISAPPGQGTSGRTSVAVMSELPALPPKRSLLPFVLGGLGLVAAMGVGVLLFPRGHGLPAQGAVGPSGLSATAAAENPPALPEPTAGLEREPVVTAAPDAGATQPTPGGKESAVGAPSANVPSPSTPKKQGRATVTPAPVAPHAKPAVPSAPDPGF